MSKLVQEVSNYFAIHKINTASYDLRNYLYYHQNQEFQRNSDVTIIPFSTDITSEEAQEIYENDILILIVEDDIF
jgi:hypothetical protein